MYKMWWGIRTQESSRGIGGVATYFFLTTALQEVEDNASQDQVEEESDEEAEEDLPLHALSRTASWHQQCSDQILRLEGGMGEHKTVWTFSWNQILNSEATQFLISFNLKNNVGMHPIFCALILVQILSKEN